MQHTDVNPPAAAARDPLSIVSACSNPGSRRCTCMSMNPGATIIPVASNTSALGDDRFGATPAIRPSTISTSATRSVFDAGSITLPFLMTIAMAYPITFSSTAIRTAMPFSTWFRITERWKSATSLDSSRPRLIGPGCITIASGLARSMCSSRSP